MAEDKIIDVDATPKEADWLKVIYADIDINADEVAGFPAAIGVAKRDAREGPPNRTPTDPRADGLTRTSEPSWLRRIFHLAGKHDQSSHGRKGKAGAIGRPKVLPWRDPPPPQSTGGVPGGFSATGLTNTQVGDTAEAALEQLGFSSALPPGKRQGPFDVKCCNGWEFEVKALTTESTEYKIKMRKSELVGKKRAAKAKGIKAGSVIVVMDYKKGEAHAYWREGLGNFRLSAGSSKWNYAGVAKVAA